MRAAEFWKTVTVDRSGFLDSLLALLETHGIRFCVIGGQGVNAYVEPLVSLDLDLVIAVEQLEETEELLEKHFHVERFPHSLNVSADGSELRVQVQTDSRYFPFVDRAARRDVLGISLPVARIEDVLQGKVWAAMDTARRPSKRRKDLLDIERILESYPGLREIVPAQILSRLE
jgi:Nucleotidyl transferase AbiEii toxin, Type IV TA system